MADLRFALEDQFGPIDEVRQEANIGPIISAELAQQAILLIILGSAGILGWMTFRFADIRMGATAIAALVHDVIVVVGVFAVLGTFMHLQIDALFVTAMLTVIGFSVHDTIVVYDRIRENRIRHAGEPFAAIVNHSLLQTAGPVAEHLFDDDHRADCAAALRQRRNPSLRVRYGHRDHLGDLFLDLQRQRAAGELARVG